jgi:hypothetical protein
MSVRQLSYELAQALGLPPLTQKAVLTLEVGKYPTLEVTALVKGGVSIAAGTEPVLNADGSATIPLARQLSRVQYIVRLEPFPKDGGQ